MYKGIEENFSFHVEMNLFQKDKTASTLGYSDHFREELLIFIPVHFVENGNKNIINYTTTN